MKNMLALPLVLVLAVALLGVALPGQAPEGFTNDATNFERELPIGTKLLVVWPKTADIHLLVHRQDRGVNDTLRVEAGEKFPYFGGEYDIRWFKVVKTFGATEVWNFWGP